jgi:hypothetical protein
LSREFDKAAGESLRPFFCAPPALTLSRHCQKFFLAFRPFWQRKPIVNIPLRHLLAITAALWLGLAQSQPTAPATPTDAVELRFADFFQTPVGPRGMAMSEALRQADGQSVRLVGYMVQQEIPQAGRFMLTPRPVQMSEHADGEADDLPAATVMVYLDPSQQGWKLAHARGLLELRGTLSVGRFEEADGRVSWVRLQLAPDAVRGMNSFEVSAYLHGQQHRH